MITYFDSSVLLAALLDEKRSGDAQGLWTSARVRVSSLLMKMEVLTVVRRTYFHNESRLGQNWLMQKTKLLDEYLQEINFRVVDEDIDKILVLKKELGKCRTLDAIHLATAIHLRTLVEPEELTLATFDRQMHGLAKALKFRVHELREEDFI